MALTSKNTGDAIAASDHNEIYELLKTTNAKEWITFTHKGADIASAGTLSLGSDGNYFDVSGTTGITAISSRQAGTMVILQFDGAVTLTHSASLILQGAANVTTAAGDVLVFIADSTTVWRQIGWLTASGFVTLTGTQTITNKIFQADDGSATAPGLSFDADTNTGLYRSAADTVDIAAGGVRAAQFSTVASAVNYIDIAPSATGNAVTATAEGTDTNVSINLVPKGSGTVQAAGSQVLAHSLADAKGDIIVATADNTFTRLAVGSNDQVLTADSAQSTGVKWAAASTGAIKEILYAAVRAEQTTTSTSYTDLTTAGPSVTTGTATLDDKVTITFSGGAVNNSTVGSYSYISVRLDATAAADADAAIHRAAAASTDQATSHVTQFTGLSAATHTVDTKYKVSANTGSFGGAGSSRTLQVLRHA